MIKVLYQQWMRLAERIGTINAWIILTILYFSMVMPFGLLVHLLSDPLRLRQRKKASYWIPRIHREASLEEMKRQF